MQFHTLFDTQIFASVSTKWHISDINDPCVALKCQILQQNEFAVTFIKRQGNTKFSREAGEKKFECYFASVC